MAKLPDYELNLLPEDTYKFQIVEEPEVRITGEKKWMIFKFKIIFPDGKTRKYSDVFFPGDEKYRQILLIAGAKPDEKGIPHLSNMETSELVGVQFDGRIAHIPDRKDESKIRDSIVEIINPDQEVEEDVPPPGSNDDDVPF